MMNTISKLITVSLLATVPLVSGATGRMTCDSGDQSTWKSQEELKAAVTEEGWEVRKIKVDGGCYELYGKTPEGKRVEAYFDPVSLEKLLVAQRGKILFKKGD